MSTGGSSTLGTIRGTIKIDYDGKGILKAEQDVEDLGKKSTQSKSAIDKLHSSLGLAAAGIAGGFALASKVAIDFEKQLSAIKAVSGATTAEMDQLRAKALQLGADTKFSASESAQAMEELVKAGLSVQDVLGGAADATVALAAAGEVALPEAAAIASNAMNQFNLAAKDLPKVADLIAGAANASAIDVTDFGHSLTQVGAVAHLAGQSFDDVAVAIAEMGNAGIKGSDAGTSLKTFLTNLVPTTKTAKDAMKELGIITKSGSNQFLDAAGNFKSLDQIAQVLQNSLKGLSESQKQTALSTIFGSDAIRAATVIADNGKKGFDNLSASMAKMTAADVAATRMDNVAGKIEQLKGSTETLGITIGTTLLPKINSMVQGLQKAVDWFSSLDKGTQDTIVNVLGAVSALLATVVAINKIVKAVEAFKLMVSLMKAWTIWTNIASAATKIWAAVQWVLNAAFWAWPGTWIIAAIIALVVIIVLLWKKCETFRKIVLAVWAGILAAVKAVVNWFQTSVLPILAAVWKGIAAGFQWLMGIFKIVWAFIMGGVKGWITIFQALWKFLSPLFGAIFGLWVSAVKTAWAVISAILSVVQTVFGAVFSVIWTIVSFFFNAWLSLVKTVIGFVWPYILAFLKGVWAFWSQVFSVIWGIVSWFFNAWKALVTAVIGFLWPYISKALETLGGWISKAWNFIWAVTTTWWNLVKSVVLNVWNWILGFIKGAVDRVVSIINGIKVIVDKVKQFFGQLKAAAEGGIGPLWDFVKGIPGRILSAIGNLGKLLYDSGKKIIEGLLDGIRSMIGKLKDLLGGVTDLIPDWKGPMSVDAKLLQPSGEAIMAGFMRGIQRMVPMLHDQLSGITMGIHPTVTPAYAASGARTGSSNSTTTYNQGTTIQNPTFNLKGVLDPTDPASTRRMVEELDTLLTNFRGSRKR